MRTAKSVMHRFMRLIMPAFILLGVIRCSEHPSAPGSPNGGGPTLPLVVSHPLVPPETMATGLAGSVSPVAFVSLPPGSLAGVASVRIRNLTAGGSTTLPIPIVDGGFDPVAVPASAGDTLQLVFLDGSGDVREVYALVPLKRPPVVVRTTPVNGRTDVALSARPVVVFSEPIDPATPPVGMQLFSGESLVPARVQLREPWLAQLAPASALEPDRTYRMEITQEIRASDGVPLEAPLTVKFTTQGEAEVGAVIGIVVERSGSNPEGLFQVNVGAWGPYFIGAGGPSYLSGLPSGDHLVSLLGPPNCTVETGPQPVTLPDAKPTRDTVVVTFSTSCVARLGTVRISAPTSGPIPSSARFIVMYEHFGYWDYGGIADPLGAVAPNGTLIARLPASSFSGADPYWHYFRLTELPENCSVQSFREPWFAIEAGDTLELEFAVAC